MRVFDNATADSEKMSMEDGGAGQSAEEEVSDESISSNESDPDYQLELTEANGTPLQAESCPFCGEDHSHIYQVETDKFPSLSFVNPFDHSVVADVRCGHFRRLAHLAPGDKLSIFSHEIESVEPFGEDSEEVFKGLAIGFRPYLEPQKVQELSASFKDSFRAFLTYMGFRDMDEYIEEQDDFIRRYKPLIGMVNVHLCNAKGRDLVLRRSEELKDSPFWKLLQDMNDLNSRPGSPPVDRFVDLVERLIEGIGKDMEAREGPLSSEEIFNPRMRFPRKKFDA